MFMGRAVGYGKDFVAISIPVGLSSGSPPRYYGSLIFAPLCDHATSGIISCGRSMTDSSCRCCSFSIIVAMAKYAEWHCVNQRSTINNNLAFVVYFYLLSDLFICFFCRTVSPMLDLNVPGYQSHLQLLLQRCHPACVVPYRCNVKEGPQAGAVQCAQNSLYNVLKRNWVDGSSWCLMLLKPEGAEKVHV